MRRQIGMKAQVGRPGGVDDQGHPGLVRGPRVTRQVTGGPDIRRVAQDHAAGCWMRGQRVAHGLHRYRSGQPGALIDVRSHPDRPQASQHQPEQQRPVHGSGNDHLLAGLTEG